MVLVNPEIDKRGQGYQINQSKVAIGSGGFFGQGFLQGTQTKFDFVPEQSTDFIFCTIGEEHGWIGSTFLIALYVLFMVRIVNLAERQKDSFARIYGYCVASIVFFHFMVNIFKYVLKSLWACGRAGASGQDQQRGAQQRQTHAKTCAQMKAQMNAQTSFQFHGAAPNYFVAPTGGGRITRRNWPASIANRRLATKLFCESGSSAALASAASGWFSVT